MTTTAALLLSSLDVLAATDPRVSMDTWLRELVPFATEAECTQLLTARTALATAEQGFKSGEAAHQAEIRGFVLPEDLFDRDAAIYTPINKALEAKLAARRLAQLAHQHMVALMETVDARRPPTDPAAIEALVWSLVNARIAAGPQPAYA